MTTLMDIEDITLNKISQKVKIYIAMYHFTYVKSKMKIVIETEQKSRGWSKQGEIGYGQKIPSIR